MLTQEQALRMADELRKNTARQRAYNGASWAVSLAYAQGKQWSYVRRTPAASDVYHLREIIDPGRTDVRVMLDIISKNVRRTEAAIKPPKITYVLRPQRGVKDAMVSRHVYNALLKRTLIDIKGLQVLRAVAMPRCVLGTVAVRRQVVSRGRPVTLPTKAEGTNQPLSLRDLRVSWARVLPYEIIRDPAAITFEPDENEQCFGQEKPRTVAWVKAHFGKDIATETTYGQLMSFQDNVLIASGWGDKYAAHASASQAPSVLVYEFWFRDPDKPGEWPWQLIAYYDPHKPPDDGEKEMHALHWGPSPYHGSPMHFFHYYKHVHGPFAAGMPQLLKPVQDITNMAITTGMRVMIDHAGPKWAYQQNTVENPASAFSPRTDKPIEWRRTHPNDGPPTRIAAPGANPVSDQLLASMDDAAKQQVNLAGVQFGETVKRGQSGAAYSAVADQADAVLGDMRRDDELVINEMLYSTLMDQVRLLNNRRDVVYKMLGNDFPRTQIDRAFMGSAEEKVSEIVVLPNSLRPVTPGQVRDDFRQDSKNQLIEPLAAQREMLVQGDVVMSTKMANARLKQELEIEMLLDGEAVQVNIAEDHETAMWVIETFSSSSRYLSLNEAQQDAIVNHWAEHRQAAKEIQILDAQGVMEAQAPSAAGMGSPPAEPAPTAPPGTVSPGTEAA